MPGLINCHSHLEITLMRGFLDDVEADFYSWLMKLTTTRGERLNEADVKIAALAGALEGAKIQIRRESRFKNRISDPRKSGTDFRLKT
jgi:hypothetical protein